MEQLLLCLRAHIHTPNRRQLAQELRGLQGQLRAQGLEPELLQGPLFAFPDKVREPSHSKGYPTSQVVLGGKEPACQCRRHKRRGFDPWVGKIPRRRVWQPTPVFLPGQPHGQRSLVRYSPWGHKESDTE